MNFDLAVVGAGIVGAACAFEAARSGLRTVVIERAFPASGATGAAMGHVVVMDDSEAQFALARYGRDLWAGLSNELPTDCEFAQRGTLWIAVGEEEMLEVRRKNGCYSSRGVSAEVLDPAQLHEAEPNLRGGLAGALFVKEDIVIDPTNATRYLLSHPSITVRNGVATRLSGGHVHFDDGKQLSASYLINAIGVDAARLTPELSDTIKPRKGHLLLTGPNPGFLNHQLVELGYVKSAHGNETDSVAFNVQPRMSGQVLIGSSRQFGSVSGAVDRDILDAVMTRSIEYMPSIAQLSVVRSWTGFRAATSDKLPVIGRVPGYENVFAATGHEGLGITTSLATARLIVDQILRRASAIPCEPYRADRPSLAQRKRKAI